MRSGATPPDVPTTVVLFLGVDGPGLLDVLDDPGEGNGRTGRSHRDDARRIRWIRDKNKQRATINMGFFFLQPRQPSAIP